MRYVNIHEAMTQLSKLIARLRAGETIAICRAGKPVALLATLEPARRKPRLGIWAGKVQLRLGWDSEETDREIEEMFDMPRKTGDN